MERGKRRTLPENLRLELSEYAALVRTLRVRDTLDLSRRLREDGSADDTRWPLAPEDVPIPEWSLREEILVIAKGILRNNHRPSSNGDSDYELELDDDDQRFDPLPDLAVDFLTHALNMLVYHIPARPASMQNRITPFGWDALVNILTSGVYAKKTSYVNLGILERARRRLERIYGPPSQTPMPPVDRPLAANSSKYLHQLLDNNIIAHKKQMGMIGGLPDCLPTVADLRANKQRRDVLEHKCKLRRKRKRAKHRSQKTGA
ncbi:hypothetical protein H1R20_g11782, partial [Candolleomyces eurysporus]